MKRGKAWEARLDAWHRQYRADRRAVVYRCHPPVRVLSGTQDGGRFLAAWDAVGPPDYVGVLSDGRAVVFDAKSCKDARLPLKNIPDHQARDLGAALRHGGHAFIALRCASGAFVLPWDRLSTLWLAWRRGEGAASVVPDELGRPIGPDGWLSAL